MSSSMGLTFYITKGSRLEVARDRHKAFDALCFCLQPQTSHLHPPTCFSWAIFSVPSLSAMSH